MKTKQETINKILDMYILFKEETKEADEVSKEIECISKEYLQALLDDIQKFSFEEFTAIVESDFIDSLEDLGFSLESSKKSINIAEETQIIKKTSTIAAISALFLTEWGYEIEDWIEANFDNPTPTIKLWRRLRDKIIHFC
jgi:hypothetical protein